MLFVLNFTGEVEAKYLRTVTKDDVVEFYNRYIHVNGPDRSKLAVYVIGKNSKTCELKLKEFTNTWIHILFFIIFLKFIF